MSVEVVADQTYFRRIRICLFQQPANFGSPVHLGSMITGMGLHPSSQGFTEYEDGASAFSNVFIIFFSKLSWGHGNGLTHLIEELIGFLIHANHGTIRIVWLAVQIQDVFHRRHKCGIFTLGNTPLGFQMRLQCRFFNALRTVSSEMLSMTPSITILSAIICILQTAFPAGGLLHAVAMI